MGWLQAILAIAESVPAFIQLIEQVIAAVKSAGGGAGGVAAVQAHMSAFKADSSVIGNPPSVKS
jgi:hypothetical protein